MNTHKLTLGNSEKLNYLNNLSTMITAGIPILEAVDSLLEDSKGNLRKVLEIIREDIVQGQHLYSSFSKFPNIFDKVTINVIKASEEAGTLDVALKDLEAQVQKEIEFTDKIKGALIYPTVVLVVFLAVLILILVVVIPKISIVFSRLNVDLPLPTLILIYASNLILNYTIPVVSASIGLGVLLFFLYKSQKNQILSALYKLPIISNLIKEIDLVRFSRSMFLLLTSGITINVALELAGEVVMKKDVSKSIAHAKETVLAGKNLSQGFKEQKHIFPGIIIKIIEAGEKTGTLDKSMQQASNFMDYRVSKSVKNLTTLIEPLMLVFVGILVGGIMLAIMAPIYGLIGQINAK